MIGRSCWECTCDCVHYGFSTGREDVCVNGVYLSHCCDDRDQQNGETPHDGDFAYAPWFLWCLLCLLGGRDGFCLVGVTRWKLLVDFT